MLNIGIVGRNHGIKHLENIQRYHFNNACVKAITYKEHKQKSNIKSEIHTYYSYRKMIDEEKLDALVLAGPHSLTREIIEFSAEKIKFFLIEKPVACNSEEILKIKKILQENNCTALVGHHRRFSKKLQMLKKIIKSGIIGNVVSFNSVWCVKKNNEYFIKKRSNWKIKLNEGGGPLLINGIHEIDTVRYLFGEVTLTKAILGKSDRNLNIEENITVIFKLEKEVIGTMLIGDNIPSPFSYEKTMNENNLFPSTNVDFLKIFGDKGVITFPSLTLYKYNGCGDWFSDFSATAIEINMEYEDPLKLEMDHFIRVIEGKEAPIVDIDDALCNMIVVDKIRLEIKNESVDL